MKGDPHDFTQSFSDWEISVFDNAAYFVALTIGPGRFERQRKEFDKFHEAVDFAKEDKHYCLYAVTESGRSICIDRAKWNDWLARSNQNGSR